MKTLTYNTNWYASQLHGVAVMGDIVVNEAGTAKLERDGDFFVMTGSTGTHRLAVSATDAQRLAAHWKGFIETSEKQRTLILKADGAGLTAPFYLYPGDKWGRMAHKARTFTEAEAMAWVEAAPVALPSRLVTSITAVRKGS